MTITDITRTAVIDQFLLEERPFHGQMDLVAFLKRVWDLSSMPSTDRRFKDAAGDIWQHMVNNSDWAYDYLLQQRLDILSSDDKTFLRFLETCLHPLAVVDDAEARLLAAKLNSLIEKDGYSLVVSERISGRAIYKAVELGTGASGSDPDVFEVVLSFAGEDRAYVEEVARVLRDTDVSCFYDQYEEVTLWERTWWNILTKYIGRLVSV